MQCFDDVTTFSPLQVLLLQFFPKFSGFLLMTCKKTLILIDMHSMKFFSLPCPVFLPKICYAKLC